MKNRKSFLSLLVAFVMLVTTMLGNVCGAFAEDEAEAAKDKTVKIGESYVIDDYFDAAYTFPAGADDNAYAQIGTTALYAITGKKSNLKVASSKKTYDKKDYTMYFQTGGSPEFNKPGTLSGVPKSKAMKFTPASDCEVVFYACSGSASKTVNFTYMVEGDESKTVGSAMSNSAIGKYEITGLKANKTVYVYGDVEKINVYRVDILDDTDAPAFTGANIVSDVKLGDVKSTIELVIGATGNIDLNVTGNASKLIDSYKVNDKTITVKLAKGSDVSKVTLAKTSEDKYAFTGKAPNYTITVNNVDYNINFEADEAFEGKTFSADVVLVENKTTSDVVTTSAGVEISIDANGDATAKVLNDDNKIINNIAANGKVINIILVDGSNPETTEMVGKTGDVALLKEGAKYTFEVNNVTYTINFSTESSYVPVEDVNIPLEVKYDNASGAAIDVVIGENSKADVSSDAKIVKSVSVKDSTITITLNDNLNVSLVTISANGFDVKGSNGSFTLAKDGKEYTVKVISNKSGSTEESSEASSEASSESTTGSTENPSESTTGAEPSGDLDGKVAVPVSVTVKKPSSNTDLPYNNDGSVKRVSLDDYLTEKGFYALVPMYASHVDETTGKTVVDTNYMTVSTNGTLKTRGIGSVDERCIRFTPAADGFVTKFVFAGASGTSATNAYFQQVDDESTRVNFAQNIAKGAKFNSNIALPIKAGVEYVIYSDVSMDISSIEISKPEDVFQGADVKLAIDYDGVKADSVLNIDMSGKLSVAPVTADENAVLTDAKVEGNTVTYTISLKDTEDLNKLSVTADEAYQLAGSGKKYTVTVNDKVYNIEFVFSINGQAPAEEEMTSNANYSVEVTDTDKEDNKLIVTLKLNNNDLKLTGIEGYLAYDGTLLKAVKAVAVDNALSYNGNSFVNLDNLNKAIANSTNGKVKIVGETLTNGGDTIADVTGSGVLCAIEFEIIKSGNAFVEFAGTYANAKNSREQIVPVVAIANADTVNAEVTKIGGSEPSNPDQPTDPSNPDKPKTYTHLKGDIDHNGKVGTNDAALIIREAIAPVKVTKDDTDLAKIYDIDGKEGITVSDAALAIKMAIAPAGSYTFPGGNTVEVSKEYKAN